MNALPPEHARAHSSGQRQPVIGLIGTIGAGKSTVARELAALGCVVSDSDLHARAAFACPQVRDAVLARFGGEVQAADGSIDRARVARRIFGGTASAAADRAWLESVVHPFIHQRRREEFAGAPEGTKALVIDAPLLLEAGLAHECDSILLVDAPRPLRLERLRASRGWSSDELDRRESSQWPLDRKRPFADHVVVNDCPLGSLRACVARTLDQILSEFARHTKQK